MKKLVTITCHVCGRARTVPEHSPQRDSPCPTCGTVPSARAASPSAAACHLCDRPAPFTGVPPACEACGCPQELDLPAQRIELPVADEQTPDEDELWSLVATYASGRSSAREAVGALDALAEWLGRDQYDRPPSPLPPGDTLDLLDHLILPRAKGVRASHSAGCMGYAIPKPALAPGAALAIGEPLAAGYGGAVHLTTQLLRNLAGGSDLPPEPRLIVVILSREEGSGLDFLYVTPGLSAFRLAPGDEHALRERIQPALAPAARALLLLRALYGDWVEARHVASAVAAAVARRLQACAGAPSASALRLAEELVQEVHACEAT